MMIEFGLWIEGNPTRCNTVFFTKIKKEKKNPLNRKYRFKTLDYKNFELIKNIRNDSFS